MSCFFVGKATIDDAVTLWCRHFPKDRTPEQLDALGRSWWRLNALAVGGRYRMAAENPAELESMLDEARAYTYSPPRHQFDAQLVKCAQCLAYQCCGDIHGPGQPLFHVADKLAAWSESLGNPKGWAIASWGLA